MGMNVSDTLAGTFKLKASTVIAINDAVGIGPDGKGYPIATTDYAAVSDCNYGTQQTSTATGRIFASTTVFANSNSCYGEKMPVLIDSQGRIWTLSPNSSNSGLRLQVYSANGTAIFLSDIDTGSAYQYKRILRLSNGNIVCMGNVGNNVKFQVFTENMLAISSLTTFANVNNAMTACALAGGGFAILARSSNTIDIKLATYDNSGVAVLASTTVFTSTIGATGFMLAMAELSNSDLVISLLSTGGTGDAFMYGIVSSAGAIVKAFYQLDSILTSQYAPKISVLPGYFCIGRANGVTAKAYVFDNAGVAQGAPFSATCASPATANDMALIHDGTAFWFIYTDTSTVLKMATIVPTSGTGCISYDINLSSSGNVNIPCDCFYENGMIVGVSQRGSEYSTLWVFSTENRTIVSRAVTAFGISSGGQGLDIKIVSGGDSSFVAYYDTVSSPVGCNLVACKYANTSIAGVAASSAAANDYCNIHQSAGTYPVNTLKGSPAVAFDQNTGSNINGNKGTILTNGLVLRGM